MDVTKKMDLQNAYNTLCGELGHLEVQKKHLETQIAAKHEQLATLNQVRSMALRSAAATPAPAKETPNAHPAAAPTATPVGPTNADRPAADGRRTNAGRTRRKAT